MMIGASEGYGWRYEVVEVTDGYLVAPRDLDTGSVEEKESTLFRTAAVAFAYAELSAAFDRHAAARLAGDDAEEFSAELDAQQALYADLSRRLGDDGLAAQLLLVWEHDAERRARRSYH